jgi:hypothetical protein
MSEALRKAAIDAIRLLQYTQDNAQFERDDEITAACTALRAALAEPEQDEMPNGSNCKWPSCQTEEYQQMLCKEVAQSLGIDEQSEPVDIEDLAHSALQEAFAYGLGLDFFVRYFKVVQNAAPQRREPLTTEKYTELAHRIASKYAHRSDPKHIAYTFLPNTLEQFVRSLEAEHGITGGKE